MRPIFRATRVPGGSKSGRASRSPRTTLAARDDVPAGRQCGSDREETAVVRVSAPDAARERTQISPCRHGHRERGRTCRVPQERPLREGLVNCACNPVVLEPLTRQGTLACAQHTPIDIPIPAAIATSSSTCESPSAEHLAGSRSARRDSRSPCSSCPPSTARREPRLSSRTSRAP